MYRLAGWAGELADVGDGGAGGEDAGVEQGHELHLRQRQHVLGRRRLAAAAGFTVGREGGRGGDG